VFLLQISQLLSSVSLFGGLVIAIKVVGKTSMKDFVLGMDDKFNKKKCMTVLPVSVAAFIVNLLTELGHIHLWGVSFGIFAAGFLISGAVAAIAIPTLILTTLFRSAYFMMFGVLVTKRPFAAYFLFGNIWKKRKAAAAN
jgi:hypothetical protein